MEVLVLQFLILRFMLRPNRNVITGRDAPMVFQTYAEVRLLKAEMAFRGWSVPGDAKTHYERWS